MPYRREKHAFRTSFGAQGHRCQADEKGHQGRQSRYVYVALDAEKRVTGPIYELCTENHVQMVEITTMAELGDAVGIDVGASVVSVLAE